MEKLRVAVVGAGAFGSNHLRVLQQLNVEIAAIVDVSARRAAEAASACGAVAVTSVFDLPDHIDAAVLAVPTIAHAEVGCALLKAGIDVLVEKPIAPDLQSAERLVSAASLHKRVLQVGHLERFNPAVRALTRALSLPLFFEIHRMSLFSPRSLDVDVVLDLMIHDLDIVLALVGSLPEDIQAAGISILSEKVDIANVRLAFPNGCVANLTASRVSIENVRKLRVFQPGEYFSLDYKRQDVVCARVAGEQEISLADLPVDKAEPLRLELESFLDCVRHRKQPVVGGVDAIRALELALDVSERIKQHTSVVSKTVAAQATLSHAK